MDIYLAHRFSCICFKNWNPKNIIKIIIYIVWLLVFIIYVLFRYLLCRSMTEPCGKVMVLFSTTIAASCHQNWSSSLRYALACCLLQPSLLTQLHAMRSYAHIWSCLCLFQNLWWWHYGQHQNIKWHWRVA